MAGIDAGRGGHYLSCIVSSPVLSGTWEVVVAAMCDVPNLILASILSISMENSQQSTRDL